jgi:hypothetical protein
MDLWRGGDGDVPSSGLMATALSDPLSEWLSAGEPCQERSPLAYLEAGWVCCREVEDRLARDLDDDGSAADLDTIESPDTRLGNEVELDLRCFRLVA